MAEAPLSLNMEYFVDPTNGKPVSNGKVYIGQPDLDPLVLANRVNVVVVQEDGTRVTIAPAAQPLTTGVGRILYLGDPVVVLVDQDYSIRVDSSLDAQVYYAPRANEWATGTFTVPVDNVAALKLIEGSFDGQQASLAGYYTKGDGGGQPLFWDSTSTETANDGTIFQATGVTTGRWKSVDTSGLTILHFGAIFDAGVTDSTAFIQAAFDSQPDIHIPGGDSPGTNYYKITSELTLNALQNITGDGWSSLIRQTTDNLNVITGSSLDKLKISGLHLYPNGTINSINSGQGIYLNNCDKANIKNNFKS